MNTELNELTEADYEEWIREHMGAAGVSRDGIDEQALILLLSDAIRMDSPVAKADLLVDLANKCLAMADKTLGCQNLVTTSVLLRH